MNRPIEPNVRLSVLDRLLDFQPGVGDAPASWSPSVAALKESLVRDLEWLLNTRRIAEPAPDHYPELRRSVYHFGLPDVTSRSADSFDVQRELAQDLEEAIRVFEPRLTEVRVSVRDPGEKGPRLARFVIEATLRMEPNPERVMFDTVLETPTGKFSVSGEGDA